MPNPLKAKYKKLRKAASKGVWSSGVPGALEELAISSLDFLSGATRIPEDSLVAEKTYYAFHHDDFPEPSRVVNAGLYDEALCRASAAKVLSGELSGLTPGNLEKILYTAAMSYCCARDIQSKNRDRGGPGKFFEKLVGSHVATVLGVKGVAKLEALNPALAEGLNPDHLFDLGEGKSIIHLAVKTSTRERIVQPWAHQRILDGAYGTDRIKGVMVFLTETNRVKVGGERSVQETCTPDRLRQYQMFVARIHAIYYLDPPVPYLNLADTYPFVPVRSIASLIGDADALMDPSPWHR